MRWNGTVRAILVTVATHRGGMLFRSAVRDARGSRRRGHSPPAAERRSHWGLSNSNFRRARSVSRVVPHSVSGFCGGQAFLGLFVAKM